MKQWLNILFFSIAANSVAAETYLTCRYESSFSFEEEKTKGLFGEFTASFDEQEFTSLNGMIFGDRIISSSVTPYLLKFEYASWDESFTGYVTIDRISGSFEQPLWIKGEPKELYDGECESAAEKRF